MKRYLLFLCMATTTISQFDAGTVTIFDNQFTESTWSATRAVGSGFFTFDTAVVGGLSGNGLLTQVEGTRDFTYAVNHIKLDEGFNSGTQGRIVSMNWRFAVNAITFRTSELQIRLLARLGGRTYVAPGLFELTSGRTEQFFPANVTFPGLDVSQSGAPIQFGYQFARSPFRSGVTQNIFLFFNIDIKTIPKPNSMAMALAVAAAIPFFGRVRVRAMKCQYF